MGLIAVEVEELPMTTNAAGALVGQCHFEMVMHRLGVFAQSEQSVE